MRVCSNLAACCCLGAWLLCAACGGSAPGACGACGAGESGPSTAPPSQYQPSYEHSYAPSTPEQRATVRNGLRNERKDTDGDGFPDDVDACPTEPEDHKAPDPNDGCPAAR